MRNKTTRELFEKIGFQKVDRNMLRAEDVMNYLSRLKAMELKLDGVPGRQIREITGISESEICRLFSRYTTINEDGKYFGEVALIPEQRLKAYARTKPIEASRSEQQGGLSGALGLTLAKYPELAEAFAKAVLREGEKHTHGRKFEKNHLCNVFYNMCTAYGVKSTEWPFLKQQMANRTIRTYIDQILHDDFSRAALVTGGRSAQIHSKVGTGFEPFLKGNDVFDVIEIDSHHIDAFFVLNMHGGRRSTSTDIIKRIWLIAAVCKRSKAVLAIKFVFSSEIRTQDLVDLICEAYMGSWQPRAIFSIKDLEYSFAAGMPSYVIPELKYHVWSCVALDNAMQHHADTVYDVALNTLGFALNFGPLAQPARRSCVEGLFNRIESRVMHQSLSTTGSSPSPGDGRSESPEEAAVYYQIDVDVALEVMDAYTANYNGVPQGGKNKANSPLDVLREYIADTSFLKPVSDEGYLNSVALGSTSREAKVTGSVKKGIRPRIKLDQALYTSPQLSDTPGLIGKAVMVRIDPHDYRQVEVYLEDGVFFGVVTVEAAWREIKHSVMTRKLINRAMAKKQLQVIEGQNPVIAWANHLKKNASPGNNSERKRLQSEVDDVVGDCISITADKPSVSNKTKGSERWAKLGLFDEDVS